LLIGQVKPPKMAHGKFDPEDLTDVQQAFWVGMTDQRAANIWDAADFIADLSPEAKEFLRKADKDKIKQLNANLEFYSTSRAIWRFLWIGGSVLVGAATLWKTIGDYITVKIR
jgi:mannose/fructose/N-acetylgalactosamine-specific phosphotransferase system component IID